jgi:hypothetical protein
MDQKNQNTIIMIQIIRLGTNILFVICFSIIALNSYGQLKKKNDPGYDSIQMSYFKLLSKINCINYADSTYNFVNTIINSKPPLSIAGWDSNMVSSFYLRLGESLSFCGDYSRAISIYDSSYLSYSNNRKINSQFKSTLADTIFANSLQLVNANGYITKLAKNTSIIIIGEAHYIPEHRILTYSLLKSLYNQGYNFLALETIQDSIFVNNDVSIRNGVYSNEPTYANMIRYARKIGFRIIPYDCTTCNSMTEREEIAAKKIVSVLESNKNAKIVLHTGFSHGSEVAIPGVFSPLGYLLKSKTAIDPLTINQSFVKETILNSYSSYINSFLGKKYSLSEPMIILDSTKTPIDFSERTGVVFDLHVVNPKFENLSDHFLNNNTDLKRTSITLSESEISNGLIVQLYSKKDGQLIETFDKIIPVCQKIISKNKKYNMISPTGLYYLVVRDKNNVIVSKKLHNVQ